MTEVIPDDNRFAKAPTTVPAIPTLPHLRALIMPILDAVKDEYTGHARRGYPLLIDSVERGGFFGIALSPDYGLYFVTDGDRLYAELRRGRRSPVAPRSSGCRSALIVRLTGTET